MSATDPVTTALVVKALDTAVLRHQAIAANIANAHSADYRPLRVNFEEQLNSARQTLANGGTSLTAADVASLRPFLEQEPLLNTGSTAVMIDLEMVKLAQNTLQYQALLKGLGHRISILSVAINEGRR
jgi:flagellar basal-body rod protein FlgB